MLTCDASSEYNGEYMGTRIASVFVLLAVSGVGLFFPLVATHCHFIKLPRYVLFCVRYFGSGVILATSYIHLLGEAQTSLSSPCLSGIFTEYPCASGLALMGTFTMFSVDLAGQVRLQRRRKKHECMQKDGCELLGGCCHGDDDAAVLQAITNVLLLEFGIVFHSVFVGLSLAIAGEQFITLFVAISFHQFFEGLGLGARFAATEWPARLKSVPWWLSFAYTITTPCGIAAGLGVRHLYLSNSNTSLIVVGVFDAFCLGLLIYNSLVDLMARDFFDDHALTERGTRYVFLAYSMLFMGTLFMAVIGKWA